MQCFCSLFYQLQCGTKLNCLCEADSGRFEGGFREVLGGFPSSKPTEHGWSFLGGCITLRISYSPWLWESLWCSAAVVDFFVPTDWFGHCVGWVFVCAVERKAFSHFFCCDTNKNGHNGYTGEEMPHREKERSVYTHMALCLTGNLAGYVARFLTAIRGLGVEASWCSR